MKVTAADILAKPKHMPEYVEQEEFVLEETTPFKKYVKRVEAVIRAADKEGGANYRGLTLGEVHRRMEPDANLDLTAASIRYLGVFQSQVPTRYSFIDRRVRIVPKREWPTEAKPAPYRADDPRAYPTAGWNRSYGG